jgi:hypothetical protein
MQDIELHSLDRTVQFSSRHNNRNNRGGWYTNTKSGDMEFYAECGAMTRVIDLTVDQQLTKCGLLPTMIPIHHQGNPSY